MNTIEVVFGVMILIFAVSIIAVVLFQEGKQHNSGVVFGGGGGDTFLTKHKSRSVDAFLVRWTRFIAVVFFLLIMAVDAVSFFKLLGG